MATCDYCGSTILFGGKKDEGLRFCGDKCQQQGHVLVIAKQIPEDIARQRVREVHRGKCPKCNDHGPVDVHTAHKIWSIILFSSWSSRPQISCRSCGVKSQIYGLLYSFVAGWWGVPWGIIMTPVQLVRNLIGMLIGPNPSQPSAQLEKLVRVDLAAQLLEQNQGQQPQA